MKNKMNTKKLLVSLLAFVSVFVLVATVSAAPLATVSKVEVNGVNVNSNPALVVGDSVAVRVDFNSLENLSDVIVKVTLEGDKKDVEAQTRSFDVEMGQEYSKTLKLVVPFDLKDVLSDTTTLDIEIRGSDGFKTETSYTLRVQREAYNANIMSVSVPQDIKAGDNFPVDIVLKNTGYNDLSDVYVTAKISALGIERTVFLGDIVALECDKDKTGVQNYGVDITRKCNEDDTDTLNGRLFLTVPYDVPAGVYALDVAVENDDTVTSGTVQVAIKNAFSAGNFIVSGNQLLVVNPTNEVVVYRLVPDAANTVAVKLSESLVAVPAGSSRTVSVEATSNAGAQTYNVNVFASDGSLVDTVAFSAVGQESSSTNPVAVLTVVLAIIFIVLLVVLFVLIGKKPEKADEFGESYY